MEKLNIQLFAGYMFEIEVTITNGVFTYCSAGGDAIVDNGTRVTTLASSSSLPVTIIAEASSGYELPETTQLNANSDETVEYTWNKSTGTLSINSVSGECAVTGTLICTASAGDISKINLGGNTYNVKDAYLRKPNGENELIANNKIATTYLPDYILGQLLYGGTVTGAGVATLSTNAKTKLGTTSTSITLTNNNTAITGYESNEGIYYVVSSNGSFASLGLKTGDWLISTGSAWKKIDNTDEVTSVQISATSPVASSTSSSQTGSVSTTISLENNYGDTKNPYGNKSKNLVLASPSTTTGSPSFRSLVEDDIPSLSESKITNLTTDLASKVNLSDIKVVNNGYKHVVTFNYTSYMVYSSTVSYNGIQFTLSNNVENLNTYSAIASALYNGGYTSSSNALATDNNISQTESYFTITVYGLYSEDGTNIKSRVYDSHYSSYTSGTLTSSYMSNIVDNSNELLAVVLNDSQTLITTGMDLYGSSDRPSYNNNLLALLSDVPDGIQTLTSSIKIIDLDTGIYKLQSSSYLYIYYSGSSTSNYVLINPQYGGNTLLYVTKRPYGSMGTSYIWSWFVVVPDGTNLRTNMIYGYTDSTTGSYNTINLNGLITSVKTLNTNNTTAQSASATEAISGSGTINLHKISKTGTYSDLLKKPTDTYDTSSTYNSGDVCIYNGNMYKCNTNSTTGTWDSSKWDAIVSGGSGGGGTTVTFVDWS